MKYIPLTSQFNFSVSVELCETIIYPGFEGMYLCGSVPAELSKPSGFGGKAGSEVGTGCVFPGGVAGSCSLGVR